MLNAGMSGGVTYKLLKTFGLGPKVEANDWLNNPKVLQLRKDLKAGKYASLERVLDFQRHKDPEIYSLFIAGLGQWSRNPGFLENYLQKYPQSSHALIINACHKINWAWEARTGQYADNVTEKQWECFFQRLELADELLHKAIQLAPSNVESYCYLIMLAMGRGDDKSEIFSKFTSLKIKQPNHATGHTHMLYALTRKWGGSYDAMFSFARNTYKNMQAGSPLGILIPQAHIEKWCDLDDDDEMAARDYIASEEVQGEIRDAFDNSLNHESYQSKSLDPMYASIFAMAFFLGGDYRLARQNCARLTRGFSAYPWYYLTAEVNDELNAGYILDRVMKLIRNSV